jgi:hypothetical protein
MVSGLMNPTHEFQKYEPWNLQQVKTGEGHSIIILIAVKTS